MAKIEIITRAKKQYKKLTNTDKQTVEYFFRELAENPHKNNWDPKYRYEKLKSQKYEGLPIYSLRVNNRGDRFCYSIEDGVVIVIWVLSVKTHYSKMFSSKTYSVLRQIRELCDTHDKKLAYNNMLDALKF